MERPRWLVVVQPNQRDLYELLRQRLEGTAVTVLLDRRQRERRRGSAGQGMERRVGERRRRRSVAWLVPAGSPPPPQADARPSSPMAAATDRRSAPTVGSQPCPTCAAFVELEMPRFPQTPARLEIEVGHVASAGRVAEHYAEIAAFTVSGRLLLSQRVPEKRRR